MRQFAELRVRPKLDARAHRFLLRFVSFEELRHRLLVVLLTPLLAAGDRVVVSYLRCQ